jgi:hypothetical protein
MNKDELLKQALDAKNAAEAAALKAKAALEAIQALGNSDAALNPFIFWVAIFVLAVIMLCGQLHLPFIRRLCQ